MRRHTQPVALDPSPHDRWHPSSTPIYQTATFVQESAARFGEYDYSRSGNPTRSALEAHCARLEGASRSLAYASGLAALAAVTGLVRPGEEIVAHVDLYGGTTRLLERVCRARGVRVRYENLVDGDMRDWRRAIAPPGAPPPRLVLVESVSNPLLRVADIRAIAKACGACGSLLCVDATALSPWLQRPLDLGADVVVHSATKLLSGHGDLTAGIVSTRDRGLAEELAFRQNAEGTALAPFESWLLLRGIRTLGVRLERQERTARAIAAHLANRADLVVHHPALPSHADHERVRHVADGAGVLVSFETGDEARSLAIVDSLERFAIAVSFGSVESTASVPCRMSHASVPAHLRRLPSDLVRLSIGLEDPDDLREDLDAALARFPARRIAAKRERCNATG